MGEIREKFFKRQISLNLNNDDELQVIFDNLGNRSMTIDLIFKIALISKIFYIIFLNKIYK